MGTKASLLQTTEARQDAKLQKKRRHSPHDLLSANSESEDNDHEEFNSKEVEVTAKTAEPTEEAELLKSLEADFTDDELVGAKTNQHLANIASKRRGITLPNDKLKALLAIHAKPENCPDITTVRVKAEI